MRVQPADLSAMYKRSRSRLSEIAGSLADAKAVSVPACPGWSVHDVVSHLVAVAEDVLAGKLTGSPTDEATARQVRRRAVWSTLDVLDDWGRVGAQVEEMLLEVPAWPVAVDALTHEHDVRGAAGLPGHRTDGDVVSVAAVLLGRLEVPAHLTVLCEDQRFRCGDDEHAGAAALELVTDPFEAFRFRMGRRSRRQLAGMQWNGDPEPVLDHLTVFGPSRVDIIE